MEAYSQGVSLGMPESDVSAGHCQPEPTMASSASKPRLPDKLGQYGMSSSIPLTRSNILLINMTLYHTCEYLSIVYDKKHKCCPGILNLSIKRGY